MILDYQTEYENAINELKITKNLSFTAYMEEITGINKLHACVNNLFLSRLMNKERYSPLIGGKCLEIASKVKMYLIARPDGADTLEARVDYIVEQWKNS